MQSVTLILQQQQQKTTTEFWSRVELQVLDTHGSISHSAPREGEIQM